MQPGQRRRQHPLEPRHRAAEPRRIAGQHEQHDERDERRRAPRDRAGPLHARERRRVAPRRDRGRRRTRTTPAARAPSTTSSSRSRMIVANAPVALMSARWRAQKIRANDLAGARRQHAARREADRGRAKRVRRTSSRPSGSSRYCQRSARIARFTNIVASDSASHSGRARTISRDDAPQVHVVQKQRDQHDGDRQHDDGAERAIACGAPLLERLSTIHAPYMLLLSGRRRCL